MATNQEVFLREPTTDWQRPLVERGTDRMLSKHLNEQLEARVKREAKALVELAAKQGRNLSEPEALIELLERDPSLYADYDRRFKER